VDCVIEGLTCDKLECDEGQQCVMNLATSTPMCVDCTRPCYSATLPGVGTSYQLCGSDGRTYNDWCSLVQETCTRRVLVETLHFGRCQGTWLQRRPILLMCIEGGPESKLALRILDKLLVHSKCAVFTARCTVVQSAVLRLHVVRQSVRLSVCDVGGSGPHRLEILETICSAIRSSLFVAQRPSTYSQENMGKFLGRLEVEWGKGACWSTKAAISLICVTRRGREKVLWRAYRNSPTLFRTVPSPTPYGLLFPKVGGSEPHPKLQ